MTVNTISVHELKQLQNEGKSVNIIMTMTPSDYQRIHIEKSVVFASIDEAVEQIQQISADSLIVLYCTTPECQVSHNVYRQLQAMNIVNMAVLSGGLQAWMEADFPVGGLEVD